jgi:lipid-A-disaccharide synthase
VGDLPVKLVEDRSYAARAYADAALVASGTATLETALLGTPFAIVYKLNAMTAFAAKRLVKLPRVGLANIVAGQEVAPELLQGDVNPQRMSASLSSLLEPAESARRRALLTTVRPHLGEPGAADRVAADLLTRLP